ncbi:MAG TPA: NAD(P)/FAD-dependent oxidoreductase [Spirochaetota bacterium]|nr:NAD(P)/FAD-dependent oxidoreductase [Spirochaetota bacterium]HQO22289.1 NAD(P)/FAD-dependent oxidoreductase [Spirochaetota bacterium]HQQ22538.1 NAD(P)/FAD-dependent oxidoreductase [Spirochaetota bacterium]
MIFTGEFSIPADMKDDPYGFVKGLFSFEVSIKKILRRSVDARKKYAVVINYRVEVETEAINSDKMLSRGFSETVKTENESPIIKKIKTEKEILIIGAGPAGLFAALRLIDAGFSVTILERGKKAEERMRDIELLETDGILNTESNAVFGEGGAGTYSDGKLTSRIHRGDIEYFFSRMVEFGANERILFESKPHVGSDVLREVVKNIRLFIESSGSSVRFSTRADDFSIESGKINVRTSNDEFCADEMILAIGHSARDTYKILSYKMILEKKGFAVGSRIEHPAEFINKSQYGRFAEFMNAADYKLVFNNPKTGRGVYSFCMCPGGFVVNSSSEERMLCVNGMSNSARDAEFSNSAVVVSVKPEDIEGGALEAIEFQRKIERSAFMDSFKAPSVRARDFLQNRTSKSIPQNSYRNGCVAADLAKVFPDFVISEMKAGLRRFDSMIRGFSDEGFLVGAETRTSSPVRIKRTKEMTAEGFSNVYPVGEGAGYAGGIVSSAVDGIRAADAIIEKYS